VDVQTVPWIDNGSIAWHQREIQHSLQIDCSFAVIQRNKNRWWVGLCSAQEKKN
jgi:hypothetical protein